MFLFITALLFTAGNLTAAYLCGNNVHGYWHPSVAAAVATVLTAVPDRSHIAVLHQMFPADIPSLSSPGRNRIPMYGDNASRCARLAVEGWPQC